MTLKLPIGSLHIPKNVPNVNQRSRRMVDVTTWPAENAATSFVGCAWVSCCVSLFGSTYTKCITCIGPWSEHGTSWYNCNRFDEKSSAEARENQTQSRVTLERYLHVWEKERERGYPYVLQLCWSSCVVYVSITTAMPTMNNQQSLTGICISRLRRKWRRCNKRVIFHGSKYSSWRRPLMSQCKVVWRSSGHMHSHFISHALTRLRFLRYIKELSQHVQVRMTKGVF